MESIIGKQFNCWTVIALVGTQGRHRLYKVRCVCGALREKQSSKLAATHSCGCQNNNLNQSHRSDREAVACDSGIRPPEPAWQPSFETITTEFKRVPKLPFWLILSGCRVVDREPMTPAERKQYGKEAR